MSHPQLDLSNDELLSTTRAVRKRLDFDREVEESVLMECLDLAVQAPSGSNAQGWQFVLVTDEEKKARIGELYGQVFSLYREMPMAIHHLHGDSGDNSLKSSQQRSTDSAEYLAENMGRVPAMLIPCITGANRRSSGGRYGATRSGFAIWFYYSCGLELYAGSESSWLMHRLDYAAFNA